MVRLVIGEMQLEQVQLLADRHGQHQCADQLLHQSNAAKGRAYLASRQFIMNVFGAVRQAASRYLKQLAEIGVLEERTVGREKIFLHPKYLRLLTQESNTFKKYK